ncbi:MAG: hypothetical protein AAB573_02855 [Patescibacteria group bacterium]
MSDIEKKNRVCQAREARSFKAGVDTEKLPAEVRLERIAAAVLDGEKSQKIEKPVSVSLLAGRDFRDPQRERNIPTPVDVEKEKRLGGQSFTATLVGLFLGIFIPFIEFPFLAVAAWKFGASRFYGGYGIMNTLIAVTLASVALFILPSILASLGLLGALPAGLTVGFIFGYAAVMTAVGNVLAFFGYRRAEGKHNS